jgi:hypothetical protein
MGRNVGQFAATPRGCGRSGAALTGAGCSPGCPRGVHRPVGVAGTGSVPQRTVRERRRWGDVQRTTYSTGWRRRAGLLWRRVPRRSSCQWPGGGADAAARARQNRYATKSRPGSPRDDLGIGPVTTRLSRVRAARCVERRPSSSVLGSGIHYVAPAARVRHWRARHAAGGRRGARGPGGGPSRQLGRSQNHDQPNSEPCQRSRHNHRDPTIDTSSTRRNAAGSRALALRECEDAVCVRAKVAGVGEGQRQRLGVRAFQILAHCGLIAAWRVSRSRSTSRATARPARSHAWSMAAYRSVPLCSTRTLPAGQRRTAIRQLRFRQPRGPEASASSTNTRTKRALKRASENSTRRLTWPWSDSDSLRFLPRT